MLFPPLLLYCRQDNALFVSPQTHYHRLYILLLLLQCYYYTSSAQNVELTCTCVMSFLHLPRCFVIKGETSLGNQCQILTVCVNVCWAIHGCFPSGMDKHPSPPNPTNSALASLLVQNLSFHAAKHSSK